jgi:hypothetical protein
MPLGPLIFFLVLTVVVAIIFALAFMPPNKLVEKADRKKRVESAQAGAPKAEDPKS